MAALLVGAYFWPDYAVVLMRALRLGLAGVVSLSLLSACGPQSPKTQSPEAQPSLSRPTGQVQGPAVPAPRGLPTGWGSGPVPEAPAGFVQAASWPPVALAALPVKSGAPKAGTYANEPNPGVLARTPWADMSYPSPCLGGTSVRLRSGTASNATLRAGFRPPVWGDLDGDGRLEALLTLTCVGAQRLPDRSLLFAFTGPAPRLLGVVTSESDRSVVDQVEFRDRKLIVVGLTFSPATPAKPDLAHTRMIALPAGALVVTDTLLDPIEILYEDEAG